MVGFRQVTAHPATLYGFVLAVVAVIGAVVMAVTHTVDENVLLLVSTIGGAGVGGGAGVAVQRTIKSDA
jgi:hypothetical protein